MYKPENVIINGSGTKSGKPEIEIRGVIPSELQEKIERALKLSC